MNAFGSIELEMLWASAALGLLQIVIAVAAGVPSVGLPWAMGPRDEPPTPVSKFAARLDRALKNFIETFAFFAVAILVANALGRHTSMTAIGAVLYFWCRAAYVPAYALGIPVVRTMLWFGAVVGIVFELIGVYPGI
jgi:uncharacterized MAPEG superfamily protein